LKLNSLFTKVRKFVVEAVSKM